ncbi:MAG TPA: SRPBCC domain-containing protein [Allosphingosinicella sp.]|jgi:activator of HSP90 ATPase|nr:SRPBCC domain-containing protein [Allosphingosinicella sp.]
MSEIDSRGRHRPFASAMLAMAGLALAGPTEAAPAAKSDTAARTAIHQEVTIHAPPARVYEALLDSKSFAAFTRMPARIDGREGGATWLFGGLVAGRNIELVPGKRIVQAWRTTRDWQPGTYSLVRFELRPRGSGTLLILDQTGFPAGNYDHLNAGWGPRYWQPLDKFLAASR